MCGCVFACDCQCTCENALGGGALTAHSIPNPPAKPWHQKPTRSNKFPAKTPPNPPQRAEAAWFDHHSEYSEVAASCGVGALARRINTLLGAHIRTTLPQLRRQIAEALEARAAELGGYGEQLDLGSDSAK